MQLFLSYARQDRSKVDLLAHRIRQLGHEAWLDTNLVGGQVWWDEILRRIRECDAVLLVISSAYVRSEACKSEREYAAQLLKPILPVAVESTRPSLLPSDISRLQVIDYSTPGEESAIQLAVSLVNLSPVSGLPVELPSPPSMPMPYLSELSERIDKKALNLDEQLALVVRLEIALDQAEDGEKRAVATSLLHRLGERKDLYAEAGRKITQVLASPPDVAGSSVKVPQQVAPVRSAGVPRIPPANVAGDGSVAWHATPVRTAAREREVNVRLSNVEFVVHYTAMPIMSSTGAIISIRGGVQKERKSKGGDFLSDESFDIEDGSAARTLRVQVNTKGLNKVAKFRLSVDDKLLYQEGY